MDNRTETVTPPPAKSPGVPPATGHAAPAEFDPYDPPLVESPAGPTIRVTLADGGRLEPLPFPEDELVEDIDWYDPPRFELEDAGSIRVRIVDAGDLEPLPFPVEYLDTDWMD